MKLDYSALDLPATREDIATFKTWQATHKNNTGILPPIVGKVFIVIIIVFLFMSIINTVSSLVDSVSTMFLLVVLTVGLAVGFGVAFLRWLREGIARQAKLHKFALANQAEYLLHATAPAYPGMIFNKGHSRLIVDALRLPTGIEIGNYTYETGSGKHRQVHTWSYAGVRLNRKLPHMVLDTKHNNMFGFTNLPDSFSGQKLSLEGDFDTHFTLYAPATYGRDALYIFTPDVMAALIDFGYAYDIEIVDDYLMFYGKNTIALDSPEQLESFLNIIGLITRELHDQSHRYADERVGQPTANIIAEPGRRLKKRVTILPFVIVVITFIVGYVLASM